MSNVEPKTGKIKISKKIEKEPSDPSKPSKPSKPSELSQDIPKEKKPKVIITEEDVVNQITNAISLVNQLDCIKNYIKLEDSIIEILNSYNEIYSYIGMSTSVNVLQQITSILTNKVIKQLKEEMSRINKNIQNFFSKGKNIFNNFYICFNVFSYICIKRY